MCQNGKHTDIYQRRKKCHSIRWHSWLDTLKVIRQENVEDTNQIFWVLGQIYVLTLRHDDEKTKFIGHFQKSYWPLAMPLFCLILRPATRRSVSMSDLMFRPSAEMARSWWAVSASNRNPMPNIRNKLTTVVRITRRRWWHRWCNRWPEVFIKLTSLYRSY